MSNARVTDIEARADVVRDPKENGEIRVRLLPGGDLSVKEEPDPEVTMLLQEMKHWDHAVFYLSRIV